MPHFTELPVIDVGGLADGTARSRLAIAEQVGAAAREVGFMYITGHGIDEKLFTDLTAAAADFFARPAAEKMRCYIRDSPNHRGYVPEGEETFSGGGIDHKEAFNFALDLPLDDPDRLSGIPLLGPNSWPDIDGFAETAMAYYHAVLDLGLRLFEVFAVALGEAPDSFTHHVTKAPSALRMIHYPYSTDVHDRPGIGAHTDYECFTLLRPTRPGLEVLNEAGDWIDAPPIGDAYVVNIGDMLELWTNGEFVSTTHRVRRVATERYSFPFFFNVDYHTYVEPLPRFVTPGRPARPGVVAGEHLWGQIVQSYHYLTDRVHSGEIVLPDGAAALSAGFGRSLTP
ncbi:isopenicillin N synthase family oxygenase [Nocardia sp. BMG111209]|uniref:isopenicillin N synthase family dioxygenase n=1 Tax=Nocardia sp. BMG111209 TaxID=1160137 RepID=UPI0003635D1A|nr:2-oxoglutarate and iron-dependent oxygenase domain-containing protein [Nocardia sp. BMG111209]